MKTDTPETDAAVKASNGQWSYVLKETCQRLERERDEAIRQRDETNTSSKYACDYNYEQKLKAERERDEAREDLKITQEAWVKAKAERVKALRERDEAREKLAAAKREAENLARSIYRTEYSDNDTGWELLESVAGVISQIDNMYAGVREQRDEARRGIHLMAQNAELWKERADDRGGVMSERPTPETDDAQWGTGKVTTDFARRLERERDEAREERDHWKTEYEIVVARLCGKKHARDNGIISEHEIIPKLTQERDEAREKYATEATEHMLAINKICNESKKAKEELANIESLMFGGLVQFTPKDGIAWRVFYAVMELKKERDEAREDATNYYARIGELERERDEAIFVMRETRRRLDDAWLEIERLKSK